VDLPDNVSTAIIKNLAPQLLTKAEAVKAGIANEDGSLKAAAPYAPPVMPAEVIAELKGIESVQAVDIHHPPRDS
jgi:hypothetical protein